MVRTKKLQEKLLEPISTIHNIVGDLITHCAAEHYQNMVLNKCHACELAVNREGERRPGIHCKECKNEHCNKCAGLTAEQCDMMRSMEKGFWSCKECETKNADLKAVLESMNSIKTELGTIKEGQAEVVEAVAKRLDRIEDVQEKQERQLSTHEVAIKENTRKVEEGEKRTVMIEKKLEMINSDALNVKQINAVVRELRDIENSRKNLMICNMPESSKEDPNERKKEDEKRVSEVFQQLKAEDFKPRNVIHVGHRGKYPKKLLVILSHEEESEKILANAEETTLPDDIWISRDRTFNQREGARIFHAEKKEQEETTDAVPLRGRLRGSGKGPGRPKNGSIRGGRPDESHLRKRQQSGEDDDSKWRRTEGRGGRGAGRRAGRGAERGAGRGASRGRGGRGGGAASSGIAATVEDMASPSSQLPSLPTPRSTSTKEAASSNPLQKTANRPETPQPIADAELGAAGGSKRNF